MITGKDLIAWGFTPGPWFKDALAHAATLETMGVTGDDLREQLKTFEPAPIDYIRRHDDPTPYFVNIDTANLNEGEQANVDAVFEHMKELMRVPTIKAGAVMPDACPAGSAKGTIPVGGVVATENAIHPGYHSADICCSMAISVLGKVDPKKVLDTACRVTHFGPGGRDFSNPPSALMSLTKNNTFLDSDRMRSAMRHHFGTQGDGNHFFYVGTLKSTGETAIVTHHGSRKPGALLYKEGMVVAEKMTRKIASGIPKHQSWIVADTTEGSQYWSALQIIRLWTRSNHYEIHNCVASLLGVKAKDRFWNEHNFVFQKPDGLYYHAKGATPAFPKFSFDTNGLTLIPMNMAEPILITRGSNAANGLGFSPHGAGRNFSRTQFKRELIAEHITEEEVFCAAGLPATLDARWYSGTPDISEMPGGYKNAESVRRQIAEYGLAEIVDEVLPYGCIMAGEIDWRKAGKELGDSA